jgi:glutathione S-transferase
LMAEDAALQRDLARMDQLWSEALAASGGPFLFGEFCAADAYFAPVVMRVTRYGLPLSSSAAEYCKTMEAHPAVVAWVAEAVQERDFIPEDEPYRSAQA